MSLVGGPQVNKFEQVPNDYHQLSVAEGRRGRCPGLMSRGRGRCNGLKSERGGEYLPYDLSNNVCDVPTFLPLFGQND